MLCDLIRPIGFRTDVLTSETSAKNRKMIMHDLNAGEIDVLISPSQLLGEGFDCKNLTALFLASPIKFAGKVQQVVGRVLRRNEGKKEPIVYDYLDSNGVLQASFKAKMEIYPQLGITIPN